MKTILFCLLLISGSRVSAQSDSLAQEQTDPCSANLFREAPTDSTYLNYYISETMDTVYFDNKACVILHRATSPYGNNVWRTQSGNAQGYFQWCFLIDEGTRKLAGTFEQGVFMNGTWHDYSKKGFLILAGQYRDGIETGTWTTYAEDGTIIFQCEMIDGVCRAHDKYSTKLKR